MKTIYKYLLIFFGIIFVIYYIWFRFFRERLPRDIPFNLTPITFFILICICFIYSYIIFKIILNKENNFSILNLLKKKLAVIILPITYLNYFLLFDLNLFKYLSKFFYYIIKKFTLYNDNKNYKIFIIMDLLPKVTLVCIFLFDIFYLRLLDNFYFFIILSIIPLIYTYLIYNFSLIITYLQEFLENNCYIKINDIPLDTEADYFIPLEALKANAKGLTAVSYFINIQVSGLLFDNDLYNYSIVETMEARKSYTKHHKIELPLIFEIKPEFDFISKILAKDFKDKIETIIYLKAFIDVYNNITKPQIMTKQLVVILSGYLLGWLYILIISVYTLNYLEILDFIVTIKSNKEPFSDLIV